MFIYKKEIRNMITIRFIHSETFASSFQTWIKQLVLYETFANKDLTLSLIDIIKAIFLLSYYREEQSNFWSQTADIILIFDGSFYMKRQNIITHMQITPWNYLTNSKRRQLIFVTRLKYKYLFKVQFGCRILTRKC